MSKTEDEILEELETAMASMFPRLQANDPLTLHYILNRALAQTMATLYTDLEAVVDQVDVLRATGDDLEHLVSAHLLERELGEYATGYITFRRNTPPPRRYHRSGGDQVPGRIALFHHHRRRDHAGRGRDGLGSRDLRYSRAGWKRGRLHDNGNL